MSTPSSPPPGWSPDPDPSGTGPSRSRGLVVVSVVLAVLLAAAVATIVVLLVQDDGAGRSADELAAAACERVEALPEDIDFDDFALDEPLIWELQAVQGLAAAAGTADATYEDLKDAGDRMVRAQQVLVPEEFDKALDDLLAECG